MVVDEGSESSYVSTWPEAKDGSRSQSDGGGKIDVSASREAASMSSGRSMAAASPENGSG